MATGSGLHWITRILEELRDEVAKRGMTGSVAAFEQSIRVFEAEQQARADGDHPEAGAPLDKTKGRPN